MKYILTFLLFFISCSSPEKYPGYEYLGYETEEVWQCRSEFYKKEDTLIIERTYDDGHVDISKFPKNKDGEYTNASTHTMPSYYIQTSESTFKVLADEHDFFRDINLSK